MSGLPFKVRFDFRKIFGDIKVLTFAPNTSCCFVHPISITPDYCGIFIFVNEVHEYSYTSFRDTKKFIDQIMEHLSTILKKYYAEKASRIFFDRLSHEVLAPVGAIRNRAEFLQKRFLELPDYLRRTKLNDLVQECERLVVLTEGFSILDKRKKITLSRKMTDFYDEIVKPTVFFLRPEAEKKHIFILYDEKMYDVPRLFVDPDKVKQIFYNVIGNAIKYSRRGTEISIGYQRTVRGYEFFVRNYGIGIPEGEEDLIFQVGVKGSNAARVDARGAGMGLPVCVEIIKAHGGKIWFERGEEKGELKEVIFFFLFPEALREENGNG